MDSYGEGPSSTIRYAHAMERGDQVSEAASFKFVMDCRMLSASSFEIGEEAQNLWKKRNGYVRALKFLDLIYLKSPEQWNQQDTENYNQIINKMALWRYAIWHRGISLILEPLESPSP